MTVRFSETALEEGQGRLRLLDRAGRVLLQIEGDQIGDAIRGGYLDPKSLHYSMFEFWRMQHEVRTQTAVGEMDPARAVDRFLESLDFPRPGDDGHRPA